MFRLGDEADPDAQAVVSTLDFFTPGVEKPFDFGRVAAANALSDIYAMGAEPLFALNIVGFPTGKLPLSVLEEILKGGASIATEAGIPILGGHSVDFDVPVYGMAVTGHVKVSRILRNSGAKAGDAIVLTKALGTGIVTSALRARALKTFLSRAPHISPEEEAASVASMARLNRGAASAARAFPISAATDVTGYGLLGHLFNILKASGVAAELDVGAIPVLPGARRLVDAGHAPDGSRRNLETRRGNVVNASRRGEPELLLLADAQTSGGLLLTLADDRADALVESLRSGGDAAAARIGRIVAGPPGQISV